MAVIPRDTNPPSQQPGELVINWHVTEACNYACRYCYSKWHTDGTDKELVRDPDACTALLTEIHRQFAPTPRNHARLGMKWRSVRLSLAGGEPLLYGREIVRIAAQAREIGFDISVISNGSRLTRALMTELAPQLSVLGLSLDSAQPAINREIGRTDRHSRVLPLEELTAIIQHGQTLNPNLRLKINTVVNALNFTEDMAPLIRQLAPDKWKILRMLPTVTNDLAIADNEFAEFVNRHAALGGIISAEDNGDMVESYIMIDPRGRFFQNSLSGRGYRYSDPILGVGAETAFRQISWLADKFQARYAIDHCECPA
ncbi:MAG: radical SAM protein [Rhodocyclaceae bacterium]|nr:radical SAM protein [Rhodocyclaceae bacterium]